MNVNDDTEFNELLSLMRARGGVVNKKFSETITSDINDEKIISILNEVKSYWTDDFRSTLTSLACEAVGGSPERTYPVSLMISLAGSGIGIHDDIIDKTTFKRAHYTIPHTQGPDNALVFGDVLIIKGLTKIRELLFQDFKAKQIFDILTAYESFFLEMCEGELMDIRFRKNLDVDIDDHQKMLWKLGVDIEACTRMGAIIGEGDKDQIGALSRYGRKIGYMNRLCDEVKDTLNIEFRLLDRIKNESVPLPILYTSKLSSEHHQKIFDLINKKKFSDSNLKKLIVLCLNREGLVYVKNIVRDVMHKTYDDLNEISSCEAKKYLTNLIPKYYHEINRMIGVVDHHEIVPGP